MNSLKLILALFWTLSSGPSFTACPEGSTIQEGACAVTQGITTLNAHGQCIRLNNATDTFFFIPMRLPDWQAFNANLPPGVSALPCTCTDGPVTWTESGSTCNGTVITVNEGSTSPAADSTAPTTGTASFLCSSQTWVYQGGTCVTEYNQCASGTTINWSFGGRNCSGTTSSLGAHNATQTVTSPAIGSTGGQTEVTCNDGTWNVTNPLSCDNYCTGGISGTECTIPYTETPPRTVSGGFASFTKTDGINTANLSYTCEASGSWSTAPTSVSCGSSCPSGSSTTGTGGVTTAGCRCDNASYVWNGASCVACPAGTSTAGAGGDASPAVCKCNTGGHVWNGSSCTPPAAGVWGNGFTENCMDFHMAPCTEGIGCSPEVPTGLPCYTYGETCVNSTVHNFTTYYCGGPACPAGTSVSGSGGNAAPAGCRCNTSGDTWNGSSCVSAPSCPAGTSTTGAGGAAAPAGCNCNNAGETWDGGACVSGAGLGTCSIYESTDPAYNSPPLTECSVTTEVVLTTTYENITETACLSYRQCPGSPTTYVDWTPNGSTPSCLAGTSTTGAGGDAVPAGCKCNSSGETWNGSACVTPPPTSCDENGILNCSCSPGDSCTPANYQTNPLICDACGGDGAGNGTYIRCTAGTVELRSSTTCY